MDLGLSDEQRELVASFAQLFAKESSPERVRAAEPGGFDTDLWRTLVDTGAVPMAVTEARGGWGATMVDLALVAEQVGRAAAAAPVIETQVAARLLARIDGEAAARALDFALTGESLVTMALHPVANGEARLVPAGAVCDRLIVLADDRLLLASVGDDRRPIGNLAAAPLADIDVGVADAEVLAEGLDARALVDLALDEWLTLTAAAMVGLATSAWEIACRYAAERRAFGAPIGTFQAISHPLADDATALDGARLLTHKAAWALDTGHERARELASMAFAFAARAAEKATYDAVHVHGGYGFMLEYDVQLHHRRVRGWSRVWGDADAAEGRAAQARYGDGNVG